MNKNTKYFGYKVQKVSHSFTGTRLTQFAGLSVVMKFLNKFGVGSELNNLFPTVKYNSTKYSNAQVFLSILLSSFVGINRLKRISNFTNDSLVQLLLKLKKGLNKDVISSRLKTLGAKGANQLDDYISIKNKEFIEASNLKSITLDCDSTVKTVYGNQEGAAKGYNSTKPGAKSYHPLICFLSELKIVIKSRFRTGSAYTSNGITSFIEEIAVLIPQNVEKVFFRADSGFFNGKLFDLLELKNWDYLIKVKLKNLKELLKNQKWIQSKSNPKVSICEFDYQAKGWKRKRKLKAIRTLVGYREVDYFGQKQLVEEYVYACYCSNLKNISSEELNAQELHENYKQRSTSETWIAEVKSQLLAGSTLTNNFNANDILWQLGVFAYNLSVMMRYKTKKYWKQEHNSFRDWFINIPAKIVRSGRTNRIKIYESWYFRQQWEYFCKLI
jgi:hypothetical protein